MSSITPNPNDNSNPNSNPKRTPTARKTANRQSPAQSQAVGSKRQDGVDPSGENPELQMQTIEADGESMLGFEVNDFTVAP